MGQSIKSQNSDKNGNSGTLRLLGEGESFRTRLCELLEESALFSDLERTEIEYLGRWFKAYKADPGTTVIKEGEKNANLYIVAKGELHILKQTSQYKNKRIARVKAGKCLGEMGILDGCPLSATAIAATNTTLLLITQSNFEHILQQNAKLGVKLLQKLGKMVSLRLRQTSGQLAGFLDSE